MRRIALLGILFTLFLFSCGTPPPGSLNSDEDAKAQKGPTISFEPAKAETEALPEEEVIPGRKGSILIWDVNDAHSYLVKKVFLEVYPESKDRLEVVFRRPDDFSTYDVVIRSTTGIQGMVSTAKKYPETLFVMPVGGNDEKEVSHSNNSTAPIVATRATESKAPKGTAYGGALDFYDLDNKDDGKAHVSFSNPRIAAKLLLIWEARGKSWKDALNAARKTADRGPKTHPNGEMHNKKFGYGRINVEKAIKYSGR